MGPTSSRRWQDVRGRSLHCAGFVAGCGVRWPAATPWRASDSGDDERKQLYQNWSTSYTTPYHQSKGESTKHLAAHQEQDEHGKESQAAGQDRSRKSLIDGLVDPSANELVAQQAVVLTDAIKDDDRVVHGIADQSKQRRDDRKRNLEMQQREKTQGESAHHEIRPKPPLAQKIILSSNRRMKPTNPLCAKNSWPTRHRPGIERPIL